jgi:hypothetical protein
MKNCHAQKKSNRELAPASKGRRSFISEHGNPGSRVNRFGHRTHNRDCTAPAGSLPENKISNKQLRTQHDHCFRRGNGRRNNRWENPRLQAERCVHFQRRSLWASTAGARRFMPPVKPERWKGIRNALQYGRVCPNQDSAHFNTDGKNLANSDARQTR